MRQVDDVVGGVHEHPPRIFVALHLSRHPRRVAQLATLGSVGVEQPAQECGWLLADKLPLPRRHLHRAFVLASRTVLREELWPVAPRVLYDDHTGCVDPVDGSLRVNRSDASLDVGDDPGIGPVTRHAQHRRSGNDRDASITEVVAEQGGVLGWWQHPRTVDDVGSLRPVITPVADRGATNIECGASSRSLTAPKPASPWPPGEPPADTWRKSVWEATDKSSSVPRVGLEPTLTVLNRILCRLEYRGDGGQVTGSGYPLDREHPQGFPRRHRRGRGADPSRSPRCSPRRGTTSSGRPRTGEGDRPGRVTSNRTWSSSTSRCPASTAWPSPNV